MVDKKSVFVLMPFGDEFGPVYSDFIKPTLEEVGFDVVRADDIQSQRNILRDVIEGIDRSDLIIADLTSANPNVFYELGLAHMLKKPVVLITQSIDEVPFDLRAYRLLDYSTHFAHIGKAKDKLASYAKGVLAGGMQFGSPVTDFYQSEGGPKPSTDLVPTLVADREMAGEDERGLLDHLIDLSDAYNDLTNIMEGVTSDQQELTQSLAAATEEFTQINRTPSVSSPVLARVVSRRLAERIANFNSRLKKANADYSSVAENTENSLEFIAAFQMEYSEVTDDRIDEYISSIRQLQSISIDARDSLFELANTMDRMPRIERVLNREVERGSTEIRAMAHNLDRTIASISRALANYAHDSPGQA